MSPESISPERYHTLIQPKSFTQPGFSSLKIQKLQTLDERQRAQKQALDCQDNQSRAELLIQTWIADLKGCDLSEVEEHIRLNREEQAKLDTQALNSLQEKIFGEYDLIVIRQVLADKNNPDREPLLKKVEQQFIHHLLNSVEGIIVRCLTSYYLYHFSRDITKKKGFNRFDWRMLAFFFLQDGQRKVQRRPESVKECPISIKLIFKYFTTKHKSKFSSYIYNGIFWNEYTKSVLKEAGIHLESDWNFLCNLEIECLREALDSGLLDLSFFEKAEQLLTVYYSVYKADREAHGISGPYEPPSCSRNSFPPNQQQRMATALNERYGWNLLIASEETCHELMEMLKSLSDLIWSFMYDDPHDSSELLPPDLMEISTSQSEKLSNSDDIYINSCEGSKDLSSLCREPIQEIVENDFNSLKRYYLEHGNSHEKLICGQLEKFLICLLYELRPVIDIATEIGIHETHVSRFLKKFCSELLVSCRRKYIDSLWDSIERSYQGKTALSIDEIFIKIDEYLEGKGKAFEGEVEPDILFPEKLGGGKNQKEKQAKTIYGQVLKAILEKYL